MSPWQLSFNYALLGEQCLADVDIAYDYGKARYPILTTGERATQRRKDSNVTILKLHGSANCANCRACACYDGEAAITPFDDAP